MLSAAIRFAIVSLLAFSVWAFGKGIGTVMLYSSITAVFVVSSGLLMHPLVNGEDRIKRFYFIFIPAFLLYAALWCLGWFVIRGNPGEIFGSAAGLAAMAFVITRAFKATGALLPVFAVLFLFHTMGYTLGGMCYYATHGKGVLAPLLDSYVTLGRLLWGLFYGLGFGAGIGYAFWRCQEVGTTVPVVREGIRNAQ